jgi:pyridoxamine 5'-phosphate oxidase
VNWKHIVDTARRPDRPDRAIDIDSLNPDPIAQFDEWFQAALARELPEAHAMTLATATRDGVPDARTVLLKGVDAGGFVFFSNYESDKGQQMDENPRAALVFYWQPLSRQVRVRGTVARISPEESQAYYRTRARGSRLGAWASRQSAVINSRAELDQRVQELEEQYLDDDIPLPPYWGGYRLTPDSFEFWEGRANRLHDRFRYSRIGGDAWLIERLSP